MRITIAEHIAWFTPKTKFLERKFRKHLKRGRFKRVSEPDNNQRELRNSQSNHVVNQ